MTDEQINIAVAEACGWQFTNQCPTNGKQSVKFWLHPSGARGYYNAELPDYCNDLNAMHEAEKVLQQNMAKWWNYVAQLAVVNAALGHGGEAHATARQRAEAFLRTVGKWEEAGK